MSVTERPRKVRLPHLAQAKAEGRPLAMLTAYDSLTARIFDRAGIDMLLVGDSLGNVVLGYESTLPVTLEDVVRATGAVVRATSRPLIIADLPFGTYQLGPQQACASAIELMRTGANAVKLEGGSERAQTIRFLVDAGIPVMAHLGYTPQSEHLIGGPRMQGRGDAATQLLDDALAIQEAGAFAVVLEMVPGTIAGQISRTLRIPTIGIGAGPECDGQVLVWSDMAGMTDWVPSFARRFGEVGAALEKAADDYVEAVRERTYPSEGHYHPK